jgi:predicted transcriptional regulator
MVVGIWLLHCAFMKPDSRIGNTNTVPIVLTDSRAIFKLTCMEVRFKPETESRLIELAASSGRAPDDLVEDAMSGYLAEIAEVRDTLGTRYDEIKSGRAKPIDGEAFFEGLRKREDDLLKKNSPK